MKKSFKAVSVGIVCLLLLAVMSGCGATAPEPQQPGQPDAEQPGQPAAEVITLVFAEVNPIDTIVGKTGMAFKEKVEELSGGTIIIDIQASGVLGAEHDVLDTMLGGGGTIDMARISAFALTSYGGEKSKLLSVPFTFVNREHFWNFATSDLAPEFLMEPYENGTGVRGLFYGEEGFRHFFTTTPVNSIEDLSGMKLRVSTDPVMQGMVQALGASPTVISFGELYSALQTGVVDGAEQPIVNYRANAFQEVAPHMILNGHTLGAVQVIITDGAWSQLTKEQQEILMEAGRYASAFNRRISEETENEVLAALRAEGINIVEVDDPSPWQEAVKAVVAAATADNAALYQKIVDMR